MVYSIEQIQKSREYFPRGLIQPSGSFRFSIDALLLGGFLSLSTHEKEHPARLLDIGTGCGVVAFHMLMRFDNIKATGVDIQPPLLDAALKNAERLGFTERFTALTMDVSSLTGQVPDAFADFFDLALANPPYRLIGRGRLPKDQERLTALFGNKDTLHYFCKAAALGLKDKGRFGIIVPAERLPELLSALKKNHFGIVRQLNVHPRKGEVPKLSLVEAQKGVCPIPEIAPPLFLYEGRGEDTTITEQALSYCPFLR